MNRKQFHPFFFSQGFCHFSQGFALPEQKSWSKKLEQKVGAKKLEQKSCLPPSSFLSVPLCFFLILQCQLLKGGYCNEMLNFICSDSVNPINVFG